MTPQEFKHEIYDHYTDLEGMITIDRDPTTKWTYGNSLLNAGIFYTRLALANAVDLNDKARFVAMVKACEVVPGLYNRNPGRLDYFEGYDDYLGIAAASFFLNEYQSAEDIANYGHQTHWCFDNQNPYTNSLRSWHGRFMGVPTFYEISALYEISFYEKMALEAGIRGAIDKPKDHASEKILAWLMVSVMKNLEELPIVTDLFDSHLKETYGSIEGLFSAYFPKGHPFCEEIS